MEIPMKTDKEKLDEIEDFLDNGHVTQIKRMLRELPRNAPDYFSPYIRAIKLYRTLTGVGLKEAKRFVDDIRDNL
jgi:hypothetical protein